MENGGLFVSIVLLLHILDYLTLAEVHKRIDDKKTDSLKISFLHFI